MHAEPVRMAALQSKEYCSCSANVKFYNGLSKLKSMMDVRLQREFNNAHDPHAIKVVLKSGEVLGHLEKKYAGVLAHIMDAQLPGLIIKA